MLTSRFRNAQGYATTAASAEAVARLDDAITGYLAARADARRRLDHARESDPDAVLAHCLDGYLHMLTGTRESLAAARTAARHAAARAARAPVTARERHHVAALDAWAAGDWREAVRQWGRLLAEYPRDLLAIRVSQFALSYLGESRGMATTMAGVLDAWRPGDPGYGFVLGCQAYALEEAGDYDRAEVTGRRAVELNPADIWAAHAVAHVREMRGQLREGVAWIAELGDQWTAAPDFAAHLRWHEGLFRLELGEDREVLALYDRAVRPREGGQYLDVVNAVSLLWRLEQAEVEVGSRWRELGPLTTIHLVDHALVFADLHYVMALAAIGDADQLAAFRDSCARFAGGGGTEAQVMANVGLALADGVMAHRRGAYGEAVDRILPVRASIRQVGGSHAQRDLFELLLIDAACRDGRWALAAELLAERVASRPGNRWGWAHLARAREALGQPGAVEARRTLDRLRAP